jgi:hypothetical protein
MLVGEIAGDLAHLEQNALLREEVNFAARNEALDFLEFHLIERLASLISEPDAAADFLTLRRRAEQLQHQLEAIDAALFQRLRVGVRNGQWRGAAFRVLVEKYVGFNGAGNQELPPPAGYDMLDAFTNGLFPLGQLPLETTAPEPEMVHHF